MEKIVLDTSVVVKWFSEESGSKKAKEILKNLEKEEVEIFLPELAKYELANALLSGKGLSCAQAQVALKAFYFLPIIFTPESLNLAKTSYQLAKKLNITYYDACFLSLAKELKATLITANPKHQKKITSVRVTFL